jgi:hypothetical protein
VLKKIISGGQTGADMGALIAARELGLETGGFAPKGWLTENGPQESLLRDFGLMECEEDGYAARTRRNIVESDGTVIIGQHDSGGTGLTYRLATELKKPLFIVACLHPFEAPIDAARAEQFRNWLQQDRIETLNVAGNRESQIPGIADYTRAFLTEALSSLL